MRWVPNAMQAMIVAIAFYFVALWSFESLWALTAPLFGIGNSSRAQAVYEIGRLFALPTAQLMRVAAFIATLKLAVAIVFAIHILQRALAYFFGRKLDYEIMEAGLLLATFVIVLTLIAPLFGNDVALVRASALHLLLLAIVAMLIAIERIAEPSAPSDRLTREMQEQAQVTQALAAAQVLPLARKTAPSLSQLARKRPPKRFSGY